ncbi:MAG TPA: MJ0042-type zinc finger domain-containing protein [Candidatus Aquicultoraceae bacterium]|nr:MJ0042-type zinc finger domain-containing protein [Candidatus Aquicultoraceae bacterium]
MIVECDSCRTRYRIHQSIMSGFRGAKVRCRKCGGTFVVVVETPVRTAGPSGGHGRPAESAAAVLPRPLHRSFPGEGGAVPALSARGPADAQGSPDAGEASAAALLPAPRPPNNVYSLDAFRVALFRRSGDAGFDISGAIRPAPESAPEEDGPPLPAHSPETLPRHADPLPAPPEELPGTPPAAPVSPAGVFPSRRRRSGGTSDLSYPRPLHVALVYLLLAVLGGAGYLLVRFLSRAMILGSG